MDRPNHIENALVKMHSGQWFTWTDSKNKIYANLRLTEKIGVNGNLVDNPVTELPTETAVNTKLTELQTAWGYFGIIERLNNLELRATLFEADLLKSADQKPIDNEQYMLLEFTSSQVEKILKQLDDMQNNKVNISRLQKDMEKSINDIEKLKDKVRANGNH